MTSKALDYFENSTFIQVTKSNLPLLYSEAYGHYINSDYQSALDIFLAIADARLDDSLTDNAQYWVGECLLALGMPEQAIIALVNLFEFFPTHHSYRLRNMPFRAVIVPVQFYSMSEKIQINLQAL